MAEKQTAKTKVKRKVKNPETFREKALKVSESNIKPKRTAKLRQASSLIVRPVAKPTKKAFSKIRRFTILKPVFWLFRLIGLVLAPPYVRNSWRELRQVTWPTRKQSRQLTGAVLIFAAVFGATIAIVDYGLDKVFKSLLLN